MFDQFLTIQFFIDVYKNVKHRANDASNDGHRPPLGGREQGPFVGDHLQPCSGFSLDCRLRLEPGQSHLYDH